MRKAAVILAIVVAAVLGAFAVPRLVSMESYRPRVIAAISGKTGRAASFRKISLGIFPSPAIRLTEFSVAGPPDRPGETLLSAPEAELRVAFRSFLAGTNEFDTLLLSRPKITVRKRRDGTHSAADVLDRMAAQDAPLPSGVAPPTTVGLKRVRIEDATLSILSEEEGGPERRWDIAPFSFKVSGIGAREKPFSLSAGFSGSARGEVRLEGTAMQRIAPEGGGVSLSASGKAFGQKFAAEGSLSAAKGILETDLSLSFPKVDVARLEKPFPFLSPVFDRVRPKGVAKVSVKVSGDMQSLGFEVETDLTRAAWTVAEGLQKFIDTPCTLLVEGHRFPGVLAVSNAELRFPPLLLISNASLSTATGAREWSAAARIGSLEEFARSRGEGFSKWSPVGQIVLSGKGRRASASAKEEYAVDADFSGVGFSIPGRGPSISGFGGHVTVAPETVEFSPLAGLLNGQRFLLRGKISHSGSPVGEAELQMGYVNLDTLLPAMEAGNGKKGEKGDELSAWLADLWHRRLAFSASVSIDAGDLWNIEFARLRGRIRHAAGVLSFEGVRAALYGGDAVLSGSLSGAGPRAGMRATVAARGVDIGEILRRKSSLGDFLSGRATLTADVSGSRGDLATFLQTGTGSGTLRIVNGGLKHVDLLALSAAAAGGMADRAAGSVRDGDTPFRELSAVLAVGDGKVRLKDLQLVSGAMELVGDASIGCSDHTLEMLGTLWIPRGPASAPPWAGGAFTVSPQGAVAVPLVLSGTIRSPVVAIDTTARGGTPGRMLRGGSPRGGKR